MQVRAFERYIPLKRLLCISLLFACATKPGFLASRLIKDNYCTFNCCSQVSHDEAHIFIEGQF